MLANSKLKVFFAAGAERRSIDDASRSRSRSSSSNDPPARSRSSRHHSRTTKKIFSASSGPSVAWSSRRSLNNASSRSSTTTASASSSRRMSGESSDLESVSSFSEAAPSCSTSTTRGLKDRATANKLVAPPTSVDPQDDDHHLRASTAASSISFAPEEEEDAPLALDPIQCEYIEESWNTIRKMPGHHDLLGGAVLLDMRKRDKQTKERLGFVDRLTLGESFEELCSVIVEMVHDMVKSLNSSCSNRRRQALVDQWQRQRPGFDPSIMPLFCKAVFRTLVGLLKDDFAEASWQTFLKYFCGGVEAAH